MLLILTAAAVFNVIVDPYRVYNIVEKTGFNARKPRALERGYLSKLASIAGLRPERVILGNSRAQIGLDPESRQWGDRLTTYNAALPGTGPDVILSMMRAAIAAGRLRQAVVGLDFLDFLVAADSGTSDATSPLPIDKDSRSSSDGAPTLDAKTLLSLSVSLDALLDSAYTIATQRIDTNPDLTRLGFTPMRDYSAMAKAQGYGVLFRQRDQENAAAYLRKSKQLFHGNGRTGPQWRRLAEIKRLCERLERGCIFLIYPYHAHILELFTLTGLSSAFEQWKRDLVRRLEPAGGSDPGSKVVFWDFSGYHPYACEHVPAMGDLHGTMKWYWEAGHFKRELGDRVIARIKGAGDPDFGIRLDASTLESSLLGLRQGQARYRRENPADFATLEALVARHRGVSAM